MTVIMQLPPQTPQEPPLIAINSQPTNSENSTSTPPIAAQEKPAASPKPQQEKPTTSVPVPIPKPPDPTIIETPQLNDSFAISEKTIDLESIVFIGCLHRTQFYASSTQPWNEEMLSVGTGIIVSSRGHILTARHILEVPDESKNDPAGRIWTRKQCSVIQTDKLQSPIPDVQDWGFKETISPPFQKAEVFFEPTETEYQNSKAFDFTLLKINASSSLPYVSLVPELLPIKPKDTLLTIGYPGTEVAQQKLERFDGEFNELTYLYGNSLCTGAIAPCGLRYLTQRYSYTYEKDFLKPTDLGIVTPFFRGGFSGAPTFYKGNLIGIVTHRRPNDTAIGWEIAYVLPTYDILDLLNRHSISLK